MSADGPVAPGSGRPALVDNAAIGGLGYGALLRKSRPLRSDPDR